MQAEVQARLIRAAQRGDQDAFGQLYVEYKAFVFRYIRQFVRDDLHLAEDLTTETFIKVMRALPRYKDDGFQAWVARIARNVALDHLRRKKVRVGEVLVGEMFSSDGLTQSAEVAALTRIWGNDTLLTALRGLSDAQRDAIILIDIMGMTIAEAAQFLGKLEGTVRSGRSKGMSALRRQVRAA